MRPITLLTPKKHGTRVPRAAAPSFDDTAMSLHREPLRAVPPPRPLPFLPPALATLRLPDDWAASLASSAPSLAGALFGAGGEGGGGGYSAF